MCLGSWSQGSADPGPPNPVPESLAFPYLENVHFPHSWMRHTNIIRDRKIKEARRKNLKTESLKQDERKPNLKFITINIIEFTSQLEDNVPYLDRI